MQVVCLKIQANPSSLRVTLGLLLVVSLMQSLHDIRQPVNPETPSSNRQAASWITPNPKDGFG